MTTEIALPEMGEGVIEGTLSRWLVAEGDEVAEFEPIAEVETDKVTTELITDVAGTVLKLCVEEGQTVPVDTVVAYIGTPGETAPAEQPREAHEEHTNGRDAVSIAVPVAGGGEVALPRPYTGRVSPVVGRIAEEHAVDLNWVPGTGRDGRITKRDILTYIQKRQEHPDEKVAAAEPEARPSDAPSQAAEDGLAGAAAPVPDASLAPRDERLPMTKMRLLIAEHMVQSKRTSPHATTIFEFDFAAVAAHRAANKARFASDGAHLTYTVYVVAATVQALKEHPLANSVWTDEGIVLKREINIGLAAAVPDGLLVPVIRRADELSLLGLARTINDLAERARTKKLNPAELQGGTFSITNHGSSGSLLATPIINQPQAGILGIGLIEKRVKVINEAIAIRPLAYASFSFDHRILDGATADAFVAAIKEKIENWS